MSSLYQRQWACPVRWEDLLFVFSLSETVGLSCKVRGPPVCLLSIRDSGFVLQGERTSCLSSLYQRQWACPARWEDLLFVFSLSGTVGLSCKVRGPPVCLLSIRDSGFVL